MIELRKPLEGVPGLLLLTALVLFGVTIGVSLALVCHWVTMQAEVANFLGGVVGAGLGAALVVMGAVYVQQREAQERIRKSVNVLANALEQLQMSIQTLWFPLDLWRDGISTQEAATEYLARSLQLLRKEVDAMPDGEDLEWPLHQKILGAKLMVGTLIDAWQGRLTLGPLELPLNSSCVEVFKDALNSVVDVRAELPLK